ncbi:MAG: hypothetical protein EAY70_02795 [Sphingomonadales bacterium]|nr:MAG: hypothetical protein EAY70_02795 [Sphingomonadales bacterium]
MFSVEFGIGAAKRRRDMPTLPQVGDVVDLDDLEDGRLIVQVKSRVHIEEHGEWKYFCQCDLRKNWIEPQWGG